MVRVEVDSADVEVAADALWQAGPSAVSEQVLASGRVLLTADVVDAAEVASRWCAEVVELDGDAHLDAWRAFATPRRAGRHLVLQPSWIVGDPTPDPLDVVVRLDPGRTFGSGSHPSTRLALAALEDHLVVGARVLDVGCGSGVLAVAACLLGASAATGVDLDPEAVAATCANAEANEVGDRVQASTTPVEDVTGTFDLILANIGAGVLSQMAPVLTARLAPSGRLVLAGLLEAQVDEVLDAYPGCTEVGRATAEGWAAAVLRR